MNIFYLHETPKKCAEMHNDKHVVKMILEYAQLLSTAHRVLDGEETVVLSDKGRRKKVWLLDDLDRDAELYSATHINHPSAKWSRHCLDNYVWLYNMWRELLSEYTYRYGKQHSSERLVNRLRFAPTSISTTENFSAPWRAMPDDVKIGNDSLLSYRNYYIRNKYKMSRWTNREMPDWFAEGIYKTYGDVCYIVNDTKRRKIISMPLYTNANVQLSQ